MSTTDIQITELGPDDVDSNAVMAINSLLSQLTASARTLRVIDVRSIVSQPHVKLFVALADRHIVAMLSASIQNIPSRRSMTVEDVVVDAKWRRRGIGEMLTTAAEQWAGLENVHSIDLTSGPSRMEANPMYQKLGYSIRDTNTYRKTL